MNPMRHFLRHGSSSREALLSLHAPDWFDSFCEELFGRDPNVARFAQVLHDHSEASSAFANACGDAMVHSGLAKNLRDAARRAGAPRWPLEFLSAASEIMELCDGSSDAEARFSPCNPTKRVALQRALMGTAAVCHAWMAQLMHEDMGENEDAR